MYYLLWHYIYLFNINIFIRVCVYKKICKTDGKKSSSDIVIKPANFKFWPIFKYQINQCFGSGSGTGSMGLKKGQKC